MRISYKWLKTKLDLDLTPEQLSVILTDCGLEVEAVETFETVKGGLAGVVAGLVVSKEKHPEADRLSLTKVDIGAAELLSIVCGAANVAEGQKVLVATIGATIYPISGEPMTMKKSKIRGQMSEGMICAEDELGLGTSHEGILVLPLDTPIGKPAAELFNLENDYVFEIGLTANRPDAASHHGTAKDIAAVLNAKAGEMLYKPKFKTDYTFEKPSEFLPLSVKVEAHEGCRRYAGVVLNHLKVAPSPDWLQNRLKAVGVRPINNVVDITNYVLHDLGQPLHAFDYNKISGAEINVRYAIENETIITLDEQERKLLSHDVMIADKTQSLCIAGVFGGSHSGVNENTSNIFLESAYFDAKHVRLTASRLGLKTDASYRFERGTDAEMVMPAINYAVELLMEIAGAKLASDFMDVYPEKIEPFKIAFSYSKCTQLIGKAIPKETIKIILESLGIAIAEDSNDTMLLHVPIAKVDVTREVDVIEEVLRVYGPNNIEFPEKLNASLSFNTKPDRNAIENKVANDLVANGFYECMSISLGAADLYIGNNVHKDENSVKVINGLSPDHNTMRQTLLFSMLENAAYNQKRKQQDLKLFEFGNTYFKANDTAHTYSQKRELGILLCGQLFSENAQGYKQKTDFIALKSYVLNMLNKLGLSGISIKGSEHPYFSLGAEIVLKKRVLATLGKVSNKCTKMLDVNGDVFVGLIDWDEVMTVLQQLKPLEFEEISKYPSVRRDLALLVDKSINYAELEKIAFDAERKYLQAVNLFDIYEGDKIEQNKKQYALSFVFQDSDATLAEKQIESMMQKLLKSFEEKAGAKLR
jgi:phenylalanyl-tRNA synthetase beta chain